MLVDFGAEGAFAVAGPDVDDLGFRGDQDEMRDAVCLIGGGKARAHRLEFIPLDTIRLFLLQDYLQDFFPGFLTIHTQSEDRKSVV